MTQTEPDPTILQPPRPNGNRPGPDQRQQISVALPDIKALGMVDDLQPALRQWLVDYLSEARRVATVALQDGAPRRDIDALAIRLALGVLRQD